ncbi:mediator complex subunit MED14-domain-containing protein [Calycina marina]|uniref:Mediator of RNA polymerase II transcription subunit 14 n=1 Tax=Calycina marina TaxID=1763456 RepID=A0A9P8CE83_9HELO|nr:mediator complex subunit MED14-domain-containing protein [Calycina marina]
MPGVIMENGGHTNHDRQLNGITGGGDKETHAPTTGNVSSSATSGKKAAIIPTQATVAGMPLGVPAGPKEFPPEITRNPGSSVPLSKIIERLSVQSFATLQKKLEELAAMPMPILKVQTNGNMSQSGGGEVDNDEDNIYKKLRLLKFAEATHADFVKVLVITNWSRRAEEVSKVVDLNFYLKNKEFEYTTIVDHMVFLKQKLLAYRIPSPDLKTSVEVLSTGKASWMPDLGFKPVPPMRPQELSKCLDDIDTALSIRLLIEEHDKIPPHFEDYTVSSGRVTFQVHGEFEVDLTIASNDPETQFWFIDFRFAFYPGGSRISALHRADIERRVNYFLLHEGLTGCYKFLHEFVLTHKINEYQKQIRFLNEGKWIRGLKSEYLNRTLSVRYWVNLPGPKSWLLLGVRSGRPEHGQIQPKATSFLSLRWFRDGKEVKDFESPLDPVEVSSETLFKKVIAMHSSHLLKGIREKLKQRALFAEGHAGLSLNTSSHDPLMCYLTLQIGPDKNIKLGIEPTTGRFFITPASMSSRTALQNYHRHATDPITQVPTLIDQLRCQLASQAILTHALTVGWQRFSHTNLRQIERLLKEKTNNQAISFRLFRRSEWSENWLIVASISMSGDCWWMVELSSDKLTIAHVIQVPLQPSSSEPSYSFFMMLNTYAAALASQFVDLRTLHSLKANYLLQPNKHGGTRLKLPNILLRLSQILPPDKAVKTKWASDTMQLAFRGLVRDTNKQVTGSSASTSRRTTIITIARMVIAQSTSMQEMKPRVDRDIAFNNSSGVFAFRLRSQVGESILPMLIEKVNQISRLVELIGVLRSHSRTLTCETLTLDKIVFSYASPADGNSPSSQHSLEEKKHQATISFGTVDTKMKLILEKGNPHLRIADFFTMILNSREGLRGVATYLPITLPLLLAADALETVWESASQKGTVVILARAVDHYILQYQLNSPSLTPNGQATHRTVSLNVELKAKKDKPLWQLTRTDSSADGDEISEALQPLWKSSGNGWQGLRKGAVSFPGGIEELLSKIDEIIRTVKLRTSPPPQAPQAQAKPSGPRIQSSHQQQHHPTQQRQQVKQRLPQPQGRGKPPQGFMQHQQHQQRQQMTPNSTQSQGQCQNRNNNKREVIELESD